MSEWYLYDEGGNHRGPLALESLVRELRAKRIADDAWVAPERWFERAGASGWQRAGEVPEIRQALADASAGELRMVEGAFKANRLGSPEFGATAMMVGALRRTSQDD